MNTVDNPVILIIIKLTRPCGLCVLIRLNMCVLCSQELLWWGKVVLLLLWRPLQWRGVTDLLTGRTAGCSSRTSGWPALSPQVYPQQPSHRSKNCQTDVLHFLQFYDDFKGMQVLIGFFVTMCTYPGNAVVQFLNNVKYFYT